MQDFRLLFGGKNHTKIAGSWNNFTAPVQQSQGSTCKMALILSSYPVTALTDCEAPLQWVNIFPIGTISVVFRHNIRYKNEDDTDNTNQAERHVPKIPLVR